MKVIIAGSRAFFDYKLLSEKCQPLLTIPEIEIVSGGCFGADAMGELFANRNSIQLTKFPADWNKYGNSAGYIRNKQMAKYADSLIVFWDGKSRGTKLMIGLAKEYNLPILEVISSI